MVGFPFLLNSCDTIFKSCRIKQIRVNRFYLTEPMIAAPACKFNCMGLPRPQGVMCLLSFTGRHRPFAAIRVKRGMVKPDFSLYYCDFINKLPRYTGKAAIISASTQLPGQYDASLHFPALNSLEHHFSPLQISSNVPFPFSITVYRSYPHQRRPEAR